MRGENDLRYVKGLQIVRMLDRYSPRPVITGVLVAFMEEMSGVKGEEWRLINRAQYHFRKLKVSKKGKVARGSENTILKILGGRV